MHRQDATARAQTIFASTTIPTPTIIALRQVVRELVQALPTVEERNLLNDVAREAQEQNLQPEQVEARLRDTRLWQQLRALAEGAEKHSGVADWLALLVALVALCVTSATSTPTARTAMTSPGTS